MSGKAKDLQVGPPLEAQIDDAAKVIDGLGANMRKSTLDVLCAAIGQGVYLLKIRELKLRQGQACGHVSTSEEEQGFLQYIEQRFCRKDIADEEEYKRHVAAVQRGSRRYMNAARNAGLTGDHTMEDVERLRQQHVLDDLRLTDLYRLTDKPEDPGEDGKQPHNLPVQISAELSRLCSDLITLRDDTEPDVFEANVTLLRATMEKYTGHPWGIVSGADGEHGEITIVAPRRSSRKKKKATAKVKPGKRKQLSPEARRRIAAAQKAKAKWDKERKATKAKLKTGSSR